MVTIVRKEAEPDDVARPYQDALLQAISELMVDGATFTELSVARIARQAGMSRATFYLHYRDKSELVESLGNMANLDFIDAIAHWAKHAHRANWVDLHHTMSLIVERYEQHRTLIDLLTEVSAYDRRIRSFYLDLRNALATQLTDAVRRAQMAEVTHPDCAIEFGTFMTFAIERNCYYHAKSSTNIRAPWLIDMITHMCWSAIYKPDLQIDKTAPLSH